MADGSVLLEVVVEGKNVKVVQRQVEGVTDAVNENTTAQGRNTKATERASKANDHFDRGLKGIHQSSLSSGKALSKQRDLIGSSSFVGAYATLAANLYAATAAFSALKSAADVQKVVKSIDVLGTTTGTNIIRIGENIQRITGYGLSMGESMKAASLGVSAGFDSTQLETLAKVAKGASAALGRDLSDSYDRLIRGVAKLEPEILDELGIMVKIDKAVNDYALSLKKNVNELTTWERTQAFMNAVNTQGIAKFGLLADAIEASPYDKLSASLDNLSKSVINWLSNVAKIPEFFNYLSENVITLGGAISLFVSTISRQMLPVLYEGPQRAAQSAKLAADEARLALEESKNAGSTLGQSIKNLPAGYKSVLDSLQKGTASIEDQKKATNSLTRSINYYKKAIETGMTPKGKALSVEQTQEYINKQRELEAELARADDVQKGRASSQIKASKAVAKERIQESKANAIAAASSLNLGATISSIKAAYAGYIAESIAAQGATGKTAGFFATLRAGGLAAALSVRALGSALLAALPYIGLLITFGPIIKDWFVNKFFPEDLVSKRKDLIEGLFKKVTDLTTFLSKTNLKFEISALEPNFNKSIEGLKLVAAAFKEIRTTINSLLNEIEESSIKISRQVLVAPAEAKVTESRVNLQRAQERASRAESALKVFQDLKTAAPNTQGINENIIRASADLENARKDIVTYSQEVKDNQQKLIKTISEASFEAIVTRISTAGVVATEAMSSALQEVNNSAIVKGLPETTKSAVVAQVSSKLDSAAKEFQGQVNILNDRIDMALEGSGNKLTTQQQAEFSAAYKEIEQNFRNAMSGATGNLEQFIGKASGMKDEVQAVVKAVADASGKLDTPYDKALEAVQALNSGLSGTGPEIDVLNSALTEIFNKDYKLNMGFDTKALQVALQAGANATRSLAVEEQKVKNLESLSSNLTNIAGVDLAIQTQKLKVIDLQIAKKRADLALSEASSASEEQKASIIAEINLLSKSKLLITQAEISANQKVLDINNKIFSSQKEIFDLSLQTQKNNLILSKPTGELSVREEDKLVREQYAAKLDFAQKEYNLKIAGINLEYKLLEAQFKLFREQAVANKLPQETIKVLDDAMAQMGQAQASSLALASEQLTNLTSNLQVELKKASIDLASKVEVSVGSVMGNIGDIFYEDIKNTIPLVQQLSTSFASAIDSAVDSFVDAIVEGKNVFESIKDAVRNSLMDTLAEAAKSQLKLGVKLMLSEIPGLDKILPQDPAQQTATAATSVATSASSIATTLADIPMALSSLTCSCSEVAGNKYLSTAGMKPEENPLFKTAKKNEKLNQVLTNNTGETVDATRGVEGEVGFWGKAQQYATENLATVSAAGFASIATAIAAGGSTKKSIIGGILGIAGSVVGGMFGGPAGAAAGGQIGAMVGARADFAKGGVMSSSGPMPLQRYADGGIARTPQLAMFGEGSRPEAYVPLPDGRTIPVTMSNGGGNVNNISVNVAVDGSGSATTSTNSKDTQEEYSRRLGTAISNAVKQEIFNQQRPGGLLYKGRR